jgi:DNA-binding transcriptional regulator YiaG
MSKQDQKFLKKSRKELGASQEKLAKALKTTIRTVSRWETGRVDLPHPYRVWINQLVQQKRLSA